MGTIAGSWEQDQVLYDRGCQFMILMADGMSPGKVAAGTVARFREV